jgi:hypothetical protein
MTEPQVVFKCPVCQSAITFPLLLLPPDQQLNLRDGENAVPKGYYAASEDEYWTDSEGCLLERVLKFRIGGLRVSWT